MNDMQRALRPLLACVPALLLAGACSGEVAERDTNPREVARLEQHFDEVRAELLEADVSGLDAGQRARRAQHIARLEEYAAGRVFPHNHDRAERTPFFIDRHGTRCAMAYLIEQSGYGNLVARIARENNEAYIPELAGDPELIAWLDENGLTAAEAARIQPAYDDPWPPPAEERDPGYRPSLAVSAVAGAASGTLLVFNLASSEKDQTRGALGAVAGALGTAVGLLSMRAEEDPGMRRLAAANIGVGLLAVAVGLNIAFAGEPAPAAGPAPARHAAGQARQQDRSVALQPLLGGGSVGLAMGGSF